MKGSTSTGFLLFLFWVISPLSKAGEAVYFDLPDLTGKTLSEAIHKMELDGLQYYFGGGIDNLYLDWIRFKICQNCDLYIFVDLPKRVSLPHSFGVEDLPKVKEKNRKIYCEIQKAPISEIALVASETCSSCVFKSPIDTWIELLGEPFNAARALFSDAKAEAIYNDITEGFYRAEFVSPLGYSVAICVSNQCNPDIPAGVMNSVDPTALLDCKIERVTISIALPVLGREESPKNRH